MKGPPRVGICSTKLISMLNILIACDHKPSRENLVHILTAHPAFHIIAVCADTHAAVAITGSEQPDIVFVDGSSDPLAAIEATKKILSFSTAGVIALSRQPDASFAKHMQAAGALGYLGGGFSAAEITMAVMEVARDNFYCSLDTIHVPVPTPERLSAFKRTVAALRNNGRKRINETVASHWYNILRFTN